jgi:uncharacterized membrane protein YagU involved in acid resistance
MPIPGKVIASVGGGLAASLAMELVQDTWAAAFERKRASTDLDEEVEAIAAVVRLRARGAARALHYLFGVGFASAYVAAVPRARWLASAGGIAFGTGLFVLADRILIPVSRLGRSWNGYSRSERANALVSHVAYGMVLEIARSRAISLREPGS